jgi:hypothetical protein
VFKRNLPEGSSWRRYQGAQWLITLMNLAFVIAAILVAELAPGLFDSNVNLVIAACVVAVPNLLAGYWLKNFQCPRCHRPFFWTLPSRMIRIEQTSIDSGDGAVSMKSDQLSFGTGQKHVEFDLRQGTRLARTCRNCGLRIWQDG